MARMARQAQLIRRLGQMRKHVKRLASSGVARAARRRLCGGASSGVPHMGSAAGQGTSGVRRGVQRAGGELGRERACARVEQGVCAGAAV